MAKAKIAGSLTPGHHSAASELFNHGTVYTASLLSSLLSLTATCCLIQQHQHIDLKLIRKKCKNSETVSITGLETKTVKGESFLKGVRPFIAASRRGISAAEETINTHGKILALQPECIVSERITSKYIKLKITLPQNLKMAWFPQDNNSPRRCCQSTDWPAKKNREKKRLQQGSWNFLFWEYQMKNALDGTINKILELKYPNMAYIVYTST